jgi:ubiquinone/menaquinone biosynthesis C-methylase UbiE
VSQHDIRKLAENWEGFARTDPLFAICTDPARDQGKWDLEEFFASGRQEIQTLLDCVKEVGLAIDPDRPALDFGCGVGRLTQALADHFSRCVGVDISSTMVDLARQHNQHPDRCRFLVNESERLAPLDDGQFGFIYTNIVLQHVGVALVEGYLREFVRVLDTGGILIFQMPARLQSGLVRKLRARLKLGTMLRQGLALLGLREKPYVMRMSCLSEEAVRQMLSKLPVRLVDVRLTNATDVDYNGRLKYLDAPPASGPLSKQYIAVRM